LYISVENKLFDTAEFLLSKKANPKAENDKKVSILHLACEYGNLKFVKLLIEKYSDDLTKPTTEGLTPLHYACIHGNKNIVQYLIEKEKSDRIQFLKLLKEKEKKEVELENELAYINFQDKVGETALHKILRTKLKDQKLNLEIGTILVKNGADISIEDNNKKTPLFSVQENIKSSLMTEARNFKR
jgi:ankyrin repeat protein